MHALVLDANEQQPARLANGPFLLVLGAFLAVTVGTAIRLSLAFRAPRDGAQKRA